MINTTSVINAVPLLAIPRDLIDQAWSVLFTRYPEWFLLTVATLAITNIVYFGTGLLYLFVDITHWPAWFYAYKIQKEVPRTFMKVDRNLPLLRIPVG